MVTFRVVDHAHKSGIKIVEVWKEEEFIACIYPQENGLKIISKHFPPKPKVVFDSDPPPTAIIIAIK